MYIYEIEIIFSMYTYLKRSESSRYSPTPVQAAPVSLALSCVPLHGKRVFMVFVKFEPATLPHNQNPYTLHTKGIGRVT